MTFAKSRSIFFPGLNTFFIVAQSQLPCSAYVKERQTKLIKTSVRKRTSSLEKSSNELEYINMHTWNGTSRQTTANNMERPFFENERDCDNTQSNHHYDNWTNPVEEDVMCKYVPSSPPRDMQFVKHTQSVGDIVAM